MTKPPKNQSQSPKSQQPQKQPQKPKQNPSLIGSVPTPNEDAFGELESFYPFSKQEIDFLQEHNKDLDIERALKASGLKKKALSKYTAQGQALLREMRATQSEWQKAIRMNSSAAATKHLELMKKFEKDYDDADMKNQNKGSFAGTLARMSDASLKATGHYGQEKAGGGTKVEINIDLSGTPDTTKEPDIVIQSEE